MHLFKTWRQDFQSSLVVFLVALPLCLGIALASNAPLASGLLAGMVGGLIVGAISGSSISVSGPAAGLTVIVAASIKTLGSFEAFTLAVFLSGVFQIIFGACRAGLVGNYIPTSVIKGMLAAIGLILILKQFPHAIGYDVDFMGDLSFAQGNGENTFSELILAFEWLNFGAVAVALTSVAIMLFWEKMSKKGFAFFKIIPGALIAVLAGVALNELFKKAFPALLIEPKHLVDLPFEGGFKDLFSALKLPQWGMLSNLAIYKVALTIAIVGSLESLLSVEAADKLDESGKKTSKDRELFAQGVGNSISGLIGGLPVTAVIVRTSANVTAGAVSKMSAIFHGIWLVLCVVTIPHLLSFIPLSALAAVLILVGYKLTKPALFKEMHAKGMNQFIPFVATITAIMLTDLLVGIGIGLLVGFFFVLRSNIHKSIVQVTDGERILIRFHKDVSFLQKSNLSKIFSEIKPGQNVLIDGSLPIFVDDDIEELIVDFMKQSKEQQIKVDLKKSSLALSPIFKES